MALNAQDYLSQLQALLPHGAAWPRGPEATLTMLLAGLAEELARVDARAEGLIEEADPRATLELLPDWERMADLPDTCLVQPDTLQERRAALVAKLTALGGASRQYFIDVAESLGYAVTIEEFAPFVAGVNRCGERLGGPPQVRFDWRVVVPDLRLTLFRTGASRAGESLGDIDRAEDLECALSRLAPAHTNLIVAYQGA